MWHVCKSTAFCPTLKKLLVKAMFCRHFVKFLVTTPSTETTDGYVTLFGFHIFFISRAKFSYFIIFSVSVLGKSRELLYLLQVLFCSLRLWALCQVCWNLPFYQLRYTCPIINPYPTAFPYGNGMVLHFYQQQESSTTKTVHKVINKRLKTYV